MAEPARQTDPYDDDSSGQPVTRPDLRVLEGGNEGGEAPANHPKPQAVPDDNAAGTGSNPDTNKTASPTSLRQGEESGGRGKSRGIDRDSLYNARGDNQGGLGGRLGSARSKANGLKPKLFKNKLLLGALLGSSAGVIGLIILIAIIIGGYKVVDFAEHVAAYQFARNTAQMAEDATSINEEKIALESIPDNATGNKLYDQLKAKYTTASGKASDLWSKLDQYRPNKIISNYGNSGTLTFNEATTRLGRTYVKSVSINGEEVPLESKSLANSLRNNLIPGYRFVTRDVAFSRNFAPDLIDALKADDIGPITRARVASKIRQDLGISLTAWVAGRFAGKSSTDAEVAIEQDAYNVAQQGSASTITSAGSAGATTTSTTGTTGGSSNSTLNSTAQQAKAAENAQVNDAAQVKASILPNTNSLPSSVQTVLNGLKDSAFSLSGIIPAIIGFINPFYKIAVPLCLVYDGSLTQSGPTIDTQNTQTARSAVWLQSASSQLKDGITADGEVDGAFDYKLGDITQSYPEERASGIAVDTSSYASTEASPTGQYSIADVGLPSPLNGVVNSLGGACPALTNLWVAAALGGVNIAVGSVVGALTGGEGDVAIVGGEAAAETAADTSVPSLATRALAKIANGGSKAKDFGIQTGKSIALIGGATLIAKAIVVSQMGDAHNSLATGQPYDDTIDCGTNIYANEVEQQQFYGAPLADSQLPADDAQNQSQLSYQASRQSAYNRYLAVGNANSLLSRVAMASSGYFNSSIFNAPLKLGDALLNPVRSASSILNPLVSHSSFAAATATSANTYCGNVQFGFTPYEKQLIQNDPSYKPLENQKTLDDSGQEDAISAMYGKCFDGSESIGTMLATGDIQRDSSGGVLPDSGLCSPRNLGTANVDPSGPIDRSSSNGHGWGDLVFRWRVAQAYNNTLDQLTNEQAIAT